tara:strand:+ start:290 stop:619 length:330 start_codon:yes stop_codon:yes gene_type:complete
MSNSVPEIILSQLRAKGKSNKFYCWGGHSFVGNTTHNYLMFRVNGLKFKGIVKVQLNAMDLYNIYLFDNSLKMGECKTEVALKTYENVYCDELVDLIDNNIEKQDFYRF